ncbi:hypothetical protein [Psychroflexus montanilacus]|uniref:hypothetical protein n=1 Tax=Psychroflexus montanilacus TaxID=2873598 RepID=UPI001CC917B8|nr:hypothetical protein [Psychroflexus montanilacus]MBZ9650540.1 hypothetical protein [Psychroflexus montanilacus]
MLAFFRFLSFFLLGCLLVNPQIDATTYSLEKPKLIFAVDNSESINKLSNSSELNEFISYLKSDSDLNESYDLNFLNFGGNLESTVDSLSFSETSTNISKVIDYANALDEPESTFVMLTDGNQTLGEDYKFKNFNADFSSKVLVLGDTTTYRDSKIDLVNVNSYSYFKNKFPVEVFVSQNSSEDVKQKLNLIQDDKVIATKTLTIPANSSSKTEFLVTAEPVGMKVLKLILEPLADEKNQLNNEKIVSTDVIDSRSKILLISDILHPDIGFFNRILDSSKELEFEHKTTDESIDISEYDLIVFYQPQDSFQNLITEVKDKSINHFIIGGSHTSYGLLNRLDLGFQKELISSTEEYSATLNSDFSLFLVNNLNFKNYPPIKDKFGDIQLSKEYSVLLQKQLNGIDVESPLWVFKTEDEVKQSVLFGENIWRWRAKYYIENASFTKFDQSFQKIIQFLAQSKSKNTLAVDVKPVINSGENEFIKVKYYNANFESDTRYDFDMNIKNLNSEQVQISRLIKGEDVYTYDLSKLEPGEYSFTIQSDDIDLSKTGKFEILDYSSENTFENADFEGLSKLVGKENIYLFSNKSQLISSLKKDKPKSIQKSIQKTQSLINFEWLILLLALTLSLEWFFRKYKGLI